MAYFITSSYAISASWAPTSGLTTGATYPITSSWAQTASVVVWPTGSMRYITAYVANNSNVVLVTFDTSSCNMWAAEYIFRSTNGNAFYGNYTFGSWSGSFATMYEAGAITNNGQPGGYAPGHLTMCTYGYENVATLGVTCSNAAADNYIFHGLIRSL